MSAFLILTGACGLIMFFAPLYVARYFSKRWQMPTKVFWRAGLALLIIEVFHLAVISNGATIWPELLELSLWHKALIFGTIQGLFFELGRFLVLDKIQPTLRSYHQGIFFALGWSGVETVFLGLALFIGIFGMNALLQTEDVAVLFPDASQEVLIQMKEYQQVTKELVKNNPLVALSPFIERASQFMIDIALTLLMMLGFIKGTTRYTWIAVGIRTVFSIIVIYLASVSLLAANIVFIAAAIAVFYFLRILRENFPPYLQNA